MAATLTWSSAIPADWNTATNWTVSGGGSAVPMTGNTVVVSFGTPELESGVNPASGITLDLGGPEQVFGTVDVLLAVNSITFTNFIIDAFGDGLIGATGNTVFSGTINVTGGAVLGLAVGGSEQMLKEGQSTSPANDTNSFTNNGTINITGSGSAMGIGTVTSDDNINNDTFYAGTVNINGGDLVVDDVYVEAPTAVGSPANINLSNGGGFQATAIGQNTNINFLDGADDKFFLTTDNSEADITGFQAGDEIVQLAENVLGSSTPYIVDGSYYNTAEHTLEVVIGADASQYIDYTVTGNFSPTQIQAGVDSSGDIVITVACFAAGTRIATTLGPVPVEDLAVGDTVVTVGGSARTRPIVWIGRRRISIRHHPQPGRVRPIRIAAGAFGNCQPECDLLLSPDHAVLVNGTLMAAHKLINGTTIRQDDSLDDVIYFHVELDAHDVLLADGLPCESYLDTGNRDAFSGSRTARLLPLPSARPSWHIPERSLAVRA